MCNNCLESRYESIVALEQRVDLVRRIRRFLCPRYDPVRHQRLVGDHHLLQVVKLFLRLRNVVEYVDAVVLDSKAEV